MAACNVKPSISNILRKNRGLWTVYCREHSLGKQGRIQEFSIGEWGGGPNFGSEIDCETVRIFACSSTREQSIKRSETKLKTESETVFFLGRVRLASSARAKLLRRALPISLLILKKKPTVLQSRSERTVELFLTNYLLSFVAKMQRVCHRTFRQLNRDIRSGVDVRISVSNERQVWRGGDPPPGTASGISGPSCSEAD